MDNSYIELNQVLDELDEELNSLERIGSEQAYASAEYYKQKRIRCTQLKADGMAVTLIQQIVKGEETVNPAYLKAMLKDAEYKATQEKINVLKMRAKSLREQTNREYYV